MFIDSTLKICREDIPAFENFVCEIASLSDKLGFNVVMTASMPAENCGEAIKKYI